MVTVLQVGDDDPNIFNVTCSDSAGSSQHRVTLSHATLEKLAPEHGGIELVKAAFSFLLEREAKSDILASFDISVIKLYFPNFEKEIDSYLAPVAEPH